jgi:hypothetical protein
VRGLPCGTSAGMFWEQRPAAAEQRLRHLSSSAVSSLAWSKLGNARGTHKWLTDIWPIMLGISFKLRRNAEVIR